MNEWIKATLIRAFRTFCQTALAYVGASSLFSEVNWVEMLSASALAFIACVLTCIVSLPEASDSTESEG